MAVDEPSVRVTEKMIKEFVVEHPAYIDAKKAEIESEYLKDILASGREAFRERHQALIELNGIINAERIDNTVFENMKDEFIKNKAKRG